MAYPRGVLVPADLVPGILDAIKDRAITRRQAARGMAISRQLLSEILHGKERVSARTTARLRGWLGGSA